MSYVSRIFQIFTIVFITFWFIKRLFWTLSLMLIAILMNHIFQFIIQFCKFKFRLTGFKLGIKRWYPIIFDSSSMVSKLINPTNRFACTVLTKTISFSKFINYLFTFIVCWPFCLCKGGRKYLFAFILYFFCLFNCSCKNFFWFVFKIDQTFINILCIKTIDTCKKHKNNWFYHFILK